MSIREVLDYHLGLTCTAQDSCRVVDGALNKRNLLKGMEMPRIRTDNGPQFVANIFEEKCEELGITHERILNKTPNLVAHIEAFHFILEDECYSLYEFDSSLEVYREVPAVYAVL